MRRRDFISLIGGAAVSRPLPSYAQQTGKVFRIGYLGVPSAAAYTMRTDAFRAGLATLGYTEGKNIVIEERWANSNYDRLPVLAKELADLKVDVLVTHATPGVLAAKRATTTIPIVIAAVGDAVEVGLVASLARPGGNVTGMSFFNPELAVKRLELLKEAVPGLTQAGLVFNAANPGSNGPVLTAMTSAAEAFKLTMASFPVHEPGDFEAVFSAMAAKSLPAFVITEDPMLIANAEAAARLALKYRLGSSGFPEFAKAGGFIGYGVDFPDMWRQAAGFVDKILKGAKPGDLPIERSTKFTTVVNLKTAKAIGVAAPTSLLLRADEVIE